MRAYAPRPCRHPRSSAAAPEQWKENQQYVEKPCSGAPLTNDLLYELLRMMKPSQHEPCRGTYHATAKRLAVLPFAPRKLCFQQRMQEPQPKLTPAAICR